MKEKPREEVYEWAKENIDKKLQGRHLCFRPIKEDPVKTEKLGYKPVVIGGKQVTHKKDRLYYKV